MTSPEIQSYMFYSQNWIQRMKLVTLGYQELQRQRLQADIFFWDNGQSWKMSVASTQYISTNKSL